MKIRLYTIGILFILIALLHGLSVYFGWYHQGWRVDIPQHILGGVALGMVFLWRGGKSPWGVVLTALGGSLLWETLEFGFWKSFPALAESASLYSPTLLESMSDVGAGVLGGLSLVMAIK